jgi:hypothetical protein
VGVTVESLNLLQSLFKSAPYFNYFGSSIEETGEGKSDGTNKEQHGAGHDFCPLPIAKHPHGPNVWRVDICVEAS